MREYRRTATDDKYKTTVDIFFFLFLVSSTPSFEKPVTQIRTTVKEYITTQKPFLTLFLFRDWTQKEKIYSSVLDCLTACFTNLNFRQL